MFDPKKQSTYSVDKILLQTKLDTLNVLYGIEGIAEMINEWLKQKAEIQDYWRMEKIASASDLEEIVAEREAKYEQAK